MTYGEIDTTAYSSTVDGRHNAKAFLEYSGNDGDVGAVPEEAAVIHGGKGGEGGVLDVATHGPDRIELVCAITCRALDVAISNTHYYHQGILYI